MKFYFEVRAQRRRRRGLIFNPVSTRIIFHQGRQAQRAFTLAETMVGISVMGLLFVSLFAGISRGIALVKVTRENLRAAQILTEKMDIIRLCDWGRLTSGTNFIPTTFTQPYDITGSTNGPIYQGTVTISTPSMAESYANDLRLISIQLTWTSGNRQQNRTMSTYASKYGLQNYVY